MITFLIMGTMLGAGILGLPTSAGLAGFFPSTLIQAFIMLLMLFSGIVLTDEIIKKKQNSFNYPSLYQEHLGKKGKWTAVSANCLILYGIMTAYLSAGTSIIKNIFGEFSFWETKLIMVIIYFFLIAISLGGIKIITKYNTVFIILLFFSFCLLVILSLRKFQPHRLIEYNDFLFIPAVIPIIVSAFCFHTIIPSACSSLNFNRKYMIMAMASSLLLTFLMNTIWIGVGIGSLPILGEDSLDYAFRHGLPATIPLASKLQIPLFSYTAIIFALLAIITSFIGVAISLRDFLQDLLENSFSIRNDKINFMLTYLPPLIITLIYPEIFLNAIGIVGGIGIATLFGILPSIIFIKNSRTKTIRTIGYIILIIFILFVIFEIGKETSLLQIDPKCEYWDFQYRD